MKRFSRSIAGALALGLGATTLASCGPVAGTDEVGWYRQSDSSYHLRWPDGSSAPFAFGDGSTGTFPVAGDWQDRGTSLVGWYRRSDASWHIQQPDGDERDVRVR